MTKIKACFAGAIVSAILTVSLLAASAAARSSWSNVPNAVASFKWG